MTARQMEVNREWTEKYSPNVAKVDFRDMDRKMQFPGCENLRRSHHIVTLKDLPTFYNGIESNALN